MGIPGDFGEHISQPTVVPLYPRWGFDLCHTYVYYMHDFGDASITKLIVAGIWILDTLHASFSKKLVCVSECAINGRSVGHFLYHYLITNYGVPASLEYIVWSYPASLLANLIVITVVQFFFAHKIFHLCRRKLRWLVTVPIVGTLTGAAHFGFAMATATVMCTILFTIFTEILIFLCRLVKNAVSYDLQVRLYTATPGACAIALAEVLITVSLCLLLYEGGSHSAVPRTKRLLNTLIVYAVNRCWLTLLVVIGEVTTVRMTYCKATTALSRFVQDADDQISWAIALDFIVGKLYANSLLASLNTRQHLRSQDSGSELDLNMNVIHFTNPSKLSGDMGSSKDGVRRFDGCEVVVIGAATELESAEIMTLQREAGVRY
ncbi:hypothetical protein EDD17DRAFT_1894101 [Pisolithus thermaeus]|nr:hypothetical protein EDD17DRAFT_1894101 [Pisolithus thermaeus]